jgi:hypothetical protein
MVRSEAARGECGQPVYHKAKKKQTWPARVVSQYDGAAAALVLGGAQLPFVLAPLGLLLGLSLDVAELTPNGIYYFHYVTIPYSTIALVFPLPVIIYYLVWKYLIGFLTRLLGIG